MRLEDARGLKQELLASVTAARAPLTSLAVAAQKLRALPRIHRSVALGVAPGGPQGYRLAVRVQHREVDRRTLADIRKRAAREVDVRYVGHIGKLAGPTPHDWMGRLRPLRIGSSIGHYAITAGTLGAFVRTGQASGGAARPAASGGPGGPTLPGVIYILSNNHVLANENAAREGDAVLQPGPYDGGTAADQVASLAAFVRLQKGKVNAVDAAIAELVAGMPYEAVLLGDGARLIGIADLLESGDDAVSKTGRTTGYTEGRVTAFELDNVVVGYDIGNLRFDEQLEIESTDRGPFSQGGDSGSLIVGATGHGAAGLLFAGSDQGGSRGLGLTYANPIAAVLEALEIELALPVDPRSTVAPGAR